jgi:hypothetical protein
MLDDRSLEYRASAAECLRLAGNATSPSERAALLRMARRWMVLAGGTAVALQIDDTLLPEANDRRADKP